jgi:hypothetical protein
MEASPITVNTGSEEAISKARSWLRTCLNDHGVYGSCSITSGKLPTRVLRIDAPDQVRRHISSDEYADYACLSHCWGKQPDTLLKLNQSTMTIFQTGIPWSSLPKTFRDAIFVTYQLGVHYLWIDSLFIIQGAYLDVQSSVRPH